MPGLLFSETGNPGQGEEFRFEDVAFEELMRHPNGGVT